MHRKLVRLVMAQWWHERDTTTPAAWFPLSPDSKANRRIRAKRFARLDFSSLTVQGRSADTNQEGQ
jgi:hypothetical protein